MLTGRSSQAITWERALRQADGWYASAEARRVAENVLLYQRETGGWPKDVDMASVLTAADRTRLARERAARDSTIDNGATVTQIRFLARVQAATAEVRLAESIGAGVAYLLRAQYPNGGWPQVFPLRDDYTRYVTFNDDAMAGVLTLLDEIGRGRVGAAIVGVSERAAAAEAVSRAIPLILRTQIESGGRRTGWCQQYDVSTLQPAGARAYEHPSIASRETAGIVRFLMTIDAPAPPVVAAIEAAVAWLGEVQIRGQRVDRRPDSSAPGGFDVVVVDDPSAPPLWARFYEIGTHRPLFSSRDGVIRYRLSEIEIERRTGYSWFGDYAASLLAKEYPAWVRRVGR